MSPSQYEEWAAVAERFGVDMEQVRRDHLISHLLGAIAAEVSSDDVVFFGGTALSRTYLTHSRLSEDIDLIALASRTDVAAQIGSRSAGPGPQPRPSHLAPCPERDVG